METLNPVERILAGATKHGLSIKQIQKISGLKTKQIKYYIFSSLFIEDTNPYIHGSSKLKIRVFNYTTDIKVYFKRKSKIKIII